MKQDFFVAPSKETVVALYQIKPIIIINNEFN